MADPLPQSVRDAFAAGDATITLPAGQWDIGASALSVLPGTTQINGAGCTLIPSASTEVISVRSPIDPIGASYNWIQHHATGAITPGVDTLLLPDTLNLTPGEVVMCRVGVRPEDPNEPVWMIFRTVLACDGSTVQFTEPFDVTVPVYGDAATLALTTPVDQQNKIGDFGTVTPNTSPGRGYGDDHEIIRFTGIIDALTINDLTIAWPDTYKPNGAASVVARFARNITINNLLITNPRGSGVHNFGSSVVVNGLTLEGDGYNFVFNTVPFPAVAVLGWGGTIDVTSLTVTSTNSVLWQFEVGTRATFLNVDYSSNQPIEGELQTTPFMSAPGSEPVYCTNGRFDIQEAGYLTTWGAPKHIFEDCEFVQPLSHVLNFNQFEWVGSVTIGGQRFRHLERSIFTLEIPPGAVYGELFLPDGVYRSGTITVSSLDRNPTVHAVTEQLTLDGMTATFPLARWLDLQPNFPVRSSDYRMLVRVFADTGAAPITVTIDTEFHQEQAMTLLADLNLSHCWLLDEDSDGSAPVTRLDRVGSAHLTDNNTVPSISDGPLGNACRFVAANSEVLSVADEASLTLGGSLAVWFRVATQTSIPILGKDTTSGREWSVDLTAGRFRLAVWGPNTGENIQLINKTVGNEVSVNTWHLGFVWHDAVNDLIGIQVDNTSELTAARTFGIADGTQPFRIGSVFSTFGTIDIGPVYMSPDVWTADQRADLYNGGAGVNLWITAGTITEVSQTNTSTTFSFTDATSATGTVIRQAQYSTDFDSGDPGAATWQNVTGATEPSTQYTVNEMPVALRVSYTDDLETVYSDVLEIVDTTLPVVESVNFTSSDGVQIRINLSESCGGSAGFTVTDGGDAITLTLDEDGGTYKIYNLSRAADITQSTLSYASASGNIVDGNSNEVADFSGVSISLTGTIFYITTQNRIKTGTVYALGVSRVTQTLKNSDSTGLLDYMSDRLDDTRYYGKQD